jgi:hypothetical protein
MIKLLKYIYSYLKQNCYLGHDWLIRKDWLGIVRSKTCLRCGKDGNIDPLFHNLG